MKLEDCKIGMKVKVLGKTIHGQAVGCLVGYPALERGWGYIKSFGTPNATNTVYLTAKPDGGTESGGYSPNDLELYIEPEKTEYRQLKDITPRAIFEAEEWIYVGCFMEEFIRFVTAFLVQYDEVIPFDEVVDEFFVEPGWEKWLIQHGFIEKVVEEVTYYAGQRFLNEESGNKYLLSAIGGLRNIALINLDSGNTWSGNIQVEDTSKITETEFKQLAGSWKFVEIEGK